jgi:hypothetical protein
VTSWWPAREVVAERRTVSGNIPGRSHRALSRRPTRATASPTDTSVVEAVIPDLARQVRESWLRQGLNVDVADLTSVAKPVHDRLALDFVAFLDAAGLPDQSDALLIEWWEPSKWEAVNDSLLVFADYLLHSHVYALWLGGTEAGKIAVLDGSEPRPSIGTTDEFLTAYLADDRVLYG